jgi:hypothetical protein
MAPFPFSSVDVSFGTARAFPCDDNHRTPAEMKVAFAVDVIVSTKNSFPLMFLRNSRLRDRSPSLDFPLSSATTVAKEVPGYAEQPFKAASFHA